MSVQNKGKDDESNIRLQKKMNQIHLIGCEKVQYGNVLYYPIRKMNLYSKWQMNPVRRIVIICLKCLLQDIDIKMTGNACTVVLFSRSYNSRIDYLDSFNKVAGLIKNKLVVKPKNNGKPKIKNLPYLFILFKWNRQMKKTVPNLSKRWYCLSYIFEAYMDYILIERYAKKGGILIKNLVSWCDVQAVDCFMTQMYNTLGRTTVTLQHGLFSMTTARWGIEGSLSNYFFAHGQFTVDEALKIGYTKKNTMLKVGLPSSIGEVVSKQKNGVIENSRALKIGAFLDGPLYPDDNRRTIIFLQKFCKEEGIELYLKFHPATKVADYENMIDNNITKKCYAKEISTAEFMDKVDLIIVRHSTTFLETIEHLKTVFIIFDNMQKVDVYKSVPEIRFSTVEELQEMINEIGTEKYRNTIEFVSKYFCTSGNIEMNYKKAFNSIGIK